MQAATDSERYYAVDAVVLRVQPFLEKDRLVVLYSRTRGKLSAIAKGARSPKSKLAAATQLFVHGRFFLAKGRNLEIVTQCRIKESFYPLRADAMRMAVCAQAAELLMKTVPDQQADPHLFDDWLSFLRLAERGGDPLLLSCLFQSKLLVRIGHFPELSACVSCRGAVGEETLSFSVELGGILCGRCATRRSGVMRISRLTALALKTMAFQEPFMLRRLSLTEPVKAELSKLLEQFIRRHFDLELKSEKVLAQLGRQVADS